MADIGTRIVTRAMRIGYGARGLVYFIVGVIALVGATRGGPVAGLTGALQRLEGQPWNQPILLALSIGLFLYAIWRGLDSLIDLAGHGGGFGWVERGGLFFVALLHVAFAWYAWKLAFGGADFADESGGRVSEAVAKIMGRPYGRGFVMLCGLGVVSMGGYSIWKGVGTRYRRHLERTRVMERLVPLLAFGLVARGLVLGVMGGFIIWAGWITEPSAAGGFGDALERIRGLWQGRVLLGIVGAGLIAFSIYCFIEAEYRIIPTRVGAEVRTLASAVEEVVEEATPFGRG